MSFPALGWASKQNPGKVSDKMVLFALADRHNEEEDLAWPSIKWLAEFSCLDRKTVIAALDRLEALGLIADSGKRFGQTKQVKGYRLHLNGTEKGIPETVPLEAKSTVFSGEEYRKRDTEPVIEPVEEAKASPTKRAKPEQVEIPDWIPAEPWAGFVAMRKEQGKPLKGRALTLAITELRKLADAGHPPGAVLDQSTLKSWLGLFPIKDQRNGHQQQPGSRTAGAVAAVMERLGDRATTGPSLADRRGDRPTPSLPSPMRPGWHESGGAR